MGNKFYSPLRYPGGKTKLAPFIKSIFYENNLVGCNYVELYAGGAGVALSLLFEEYVKEITINDYDRSIYAFWHSIVNHSDDFCQKILETSVTMATWHQQKQIQNNKHDHSLFDLGFSTFFLNRTNISGIIKGGVIGGLNQNGRYKIDARFNKPSLIHKIKEIAKYKNRIYITNHDALDLLESDLKNCFVYLDPPYVKKAKNLYMNFYDENNHREISKFLLLNNSSFDWLLSYDANALIKNLYKPCNNKLSWGIKYGTSKGKGEEILIASRRIKFGESIQMIASS